jgi:hypothetical protein
MEKLEEIKLAARELLVIKDKSYELFGCIAIQIPDFLGIQVSDAKFYPIMKELGIQPVYAKRFASGQDIEVRFQIEELTFFFLTSEGQAKEWGLI